MLETIELRKPVAIDGEQVSELSYDIDLITPDQFIEAEVRAAERATRLGKMQAKVVELDASFHYYLGVMAILAANPAYMVQDVDRIKGPDILKVMRVGRNFMTADAGEDEDEGSASTEEDGTDQDSYLSTLE